MSTHSATRRKTASILVALLAAGTLLAGCTSSGNDSGSSVDGAEPGMAGGGTGELVESEVAPDALESEDRSVTGDATDISTPDDRAVIYYVDLLVEVDDVGAAAKDAAAVAARFDGYVQSESSGGIDQPIPAPGDDVAPFPTFEAQSVLVLRVPAERYEQAVVELEALGETVSRTRNAQDVTQEVVDVQTRIETQEASIDRLQALLGEATKIGDIVAIETELTSRIAELESLKARQEQLATETDLATITVTFLPPDTVVEEGTGFVAGLEAGWRAFVRSVELGLTALGAALPFLLALAVLTVPLVGWLVVRHRRQQRAGNTAQPTTDDSVGVEA
ncbi:MAG: DUF4349 domain-containing protein [Jiangellales bacterium]